MKSENSLCVQIHDVDHMGLPIGLERHAHAVGTHLWIGSIGDDGGRPAINRDGDDLDLLPWLIKPNVVESRSIRCKLEAVFGVWVVDVAQLPHNPTRRRSHHLNRSRVRGGCR
jgi:hypothetical protein